MLPKTMILVGSLPLVGAAAGPYSSSSKSSSYHRASCSREFPWAEVPGYIIAQILGAFLGGTSIWLMYKDHYDETHDSSIILATFSTIPAIRSSFNNLISEIIGTFVLVFVVFYISDGQLMNTSNTPIGLGSVGALPIAFLVWCIGLGLGGTTGFAINPARDFGPRLAHTILPISNKGSSDWAYGWIPY